MYSSPCILSPPVYSLVITGIQEQYHFWDLKMEKILKWRGLILQGPLYMYCVFFQQSHLNMLELKHISLYKSVLNFLVGPGDEHLVIVVSLEKIED